MRRRAPRPLSLAVGALAHDLAPATLLADVQRVWATAAGDAVAQQSEPTAAQAGVVTVTCASSVWAQELDLLGPELVARLNEALGEARVERLRCQAAPARSWARKGGSR